MSNTVDSLFRFYLEEGGWLIFSIVPVLIFIIVLIDNQRQQRRAISWLVGLFACVLANLPTAIYAIGPAETRTVLTDVRLLLFYIGLLGLVAAPILLIGYWASYRGERAFRENQPAVIPPPPNMIDDDAETRLPGQMPPFSPPPPPYQPMPPDLAPSSMTRPAYSDPEERTALPRKPPRKPLNAWLVDLERGQRHPLYAGKNTVGRATDRDICITDRSISAQHFVIDAADDVFMIFDVGSANGTEINGYALDGKRQLIHEDIIVIGGTRLQFVCR